MPEEEKTFIQPTGAVMDVQAPKTVNNVPEPVVPNDPPSPPTAATTPAEQPKVTPLAVPLGSKTPHHSSRPIVTIICAVVVALVLAGLTVYAFQKSKDSKTSAPTPLSGVATIKASDVDQIGNDVDAAMQKIDDTKDLPAADLADAVLGL